MTQLHEPVRTQPTTFSDTWTGWVSFAVVVLFVTGAVNVLQGLIALFDDGYFLVRAGDHLLLVDITTWGVVMLLWGGLQALGGAALYAGKTWGRWFAIAVACLGIIVQFAFLSAYPIWSALIIAFDVIVVFALTAHWSEVRPAG
jgi:hypothetical protein